MKGILCHQFGAPDVLNFTSIPTENCPPDCARIEVHTVGVNFADILMTSGEYQRKPPFPFSPGLEAAGIVLECGENVTRVKPGDRVIAMVDHGAMREELIALERDLVIMPEGMDFITAAGFASGYSTADVALHDRAVIQSGEWLMVHGAGGGVGLAAVEVGKALGAKVIATAGSAEKLALAKAHGADYIINYRTEDIREKVLGWTDGNGVDVVFDPVGGDVFKASLRCVAWEGRMIVIGFAAGERQRVPANILLVKNASVLGFAWTSYRRKYPHIVYRSLDRLFDWWKNKQLVPHICQTFPLDEAASAMAQLLSRQSTGKVVLTSRNHQS